MGHRWLFVATAGASACAIAAASVWWPTATTGLATATSMLWISSAATFDMLWRLLPDAFLVLALIPVVMATAAHPLGSSAALPDIGLGAATWSVPLLVAHLLAPGALGFGDVKAAAVVGATLGLTLSPWAVAVALVVAMGSAASIAVATHRPTIALGPYLAVGAMAVLLVSFIGPAA